MGRKALAYGFPKEIKKWKQEVLASYHSTKNKRSLARLRVAGRTMIHYIYFRFSGVPINNSLDTAHSISVS